MGSFLVTVVIHGKDLGASELAVRGLAVRLFRMAEFIRKSVGREAREEDPIARLWELRESMKRLGVTDSEPDTRRCRKVVGGPAK